MAKPFILERFYKSPKDARAGMRKSLADPHSNVSRDFSGYNIGKISLAKTQPPAANGLKLFSIEMNKKRR